MKHVKNYYSPAIVMIFFCTATIAQSNFSEADRRVANNFASHAKQYSELRERIESGLPKLPKKATPEQIEAHKASLLKSVQSARTGAKRGDVFSPEASTLIRNLLKAEFKGRDRRELRTAVFEAETKGVPLRVNAAYPESKELLEMPPSLLLTLPQLPKQVRYRFVGTNLLLVDRENNLIIDYLTNALP